MCNEQTFLVSCHFPPAYKPNRRYIKQSKFHQLLGSPNLRIFQPNTWNSAEMVFPNDFPLQLLCPKKITSPNIQQCPPPSSPWHRQAVLSSWSVGSPKVRRRTTSSKARKGLVSTWVSTSEEGQLQISGLENKDSAKSYLAIWSRMMSLSYPAWEFHANRKMIVQLYSWPFYPFLGFHVRFQVARTTPLQLRQADIPCPQIIGTKKGIRHTVTIPFYWHPWNSMQGILVRGPVHCFTGLV